MKDTQKKRKKSIMSDFIPQQIDNDTDDASLISEDSQEPYFEVTTGRIVPAREAWQVLAAEGHPRYKHLASSASSGSSPGNEDTQTQPSAADLDSVFRTGTGTAADDDNNGGQGPLPPALSSCSSGGGPTQSSIDRALHPEMNDPRRNNLPPSNHGPKKDTLPVVDVDEDEETDPIIIRAKAMAMAAQNGQKLTPEQLQLIAQPDVQQQKLIEEAKRMARNNSRHGGNNSTHGSGSIINLHHNLEQKGKELQQFGKDIKTFISTEQGKPPSQWSADLGKFFEEQSLKKSVNKNDVGEVDEISTTSTEGGGETPRATPIRKKMEGFGTDPSAQVEPKGSPSLSQRISLLGGDESSTAKWPNVPLPLLNKIIGNDEEESFEKLPVRISGVLWKRRSGFGKHSANAWEKRRVELRGTRLIYYSSMEEVKEDDEANKESENNDDRPAAEESESFTPRSVSDSSEGKGADDDAFGGMWKKSIEKASLAAEQQLQTARDGLSRFAAGIDKRKSPSGDTPRGVLDLSKERATSSASMGHSGAPSPFCISIKVKSVTQWKFAFDSHQVMMQWLAALTDVVVEASLGAVEKSQEGNWKLENYCIKRESSPGNSAHDTDSGASYQGETARESGTSSSPQTILGSNDGGCTTNNSWMLAGNSLTLAWVAANVAILLARSSSTSIASFWKVIVFTNFGIWQLCTRQNASSLLRPTSKSVVVATTKPNESSSVSTEKPNAGSTTIKVSSVVKPSEINMPSWIPLSPSTMDVRSHGYLTTKKKVPSPGELYECIAVDSFASNARFSEIATRVKLPDIKFNDGDSPKTWQSPDIFIASLAIPTEAPRFGQGTDDGPGITIVGYFKMKEETRTILRRITSPGYDPSTDESESDIDVQKRIVNGVRLWEKYCKQAPSDPSFQARFKLIPSANLEDLGCPAYIAKYNGKPVLIKRNQVTGFFTDYPSLNAMSFEISFHPFPYLFKQAMAYLKDYFDNTIGSFGFVIEGRNDDELPEVMIGAMKLCYPGPSLICGGEDFFSGSCPKSSASKKTD